MGEIVKKSKILAIFVAVVMLFACPFVMTACGKTDDLSLSVHEMSLQMLGDANQKTLENNHIKISRNRKITYSATAGKTSVDKNETSFVDVSLDGIMLEYTTDGNTYYNEYEVSNEKFYQYVFSSKSISKKRLSKYDYYNNELCLIDGKSIYETILSQIEQSYNSLSETNQDVYVTYFYVDELSCSTKDESTIISFDYGYVEFVESPGYLEPSTMSVVASVEFKISDGLLKSLTIEKSFCDLSKNSTPIYKTETYTNEYSYQEKSAITFDISGYEYK